MTSAVVQTSYSQQSTSNSSLNASGSLQKGLGLTMISNNSQTASTPNILKYEAAREQFLKVWEQLEFEPRVATFVNGSEVIGLVNIKNIRMFSLLAKKVINKYKDKTDKNYI